MATDLTANGRRTRRGEPTWEVARIYPRQGEWTEEEYLDFEECSNQMVELVDGFLDFLPRPDMLHCRIVKYAYRLLDDHVTQERIGEAFLAPSPIRLGPGHMREPDVFLLKPHRIKDRHQPPKGTDLVMEVVSPGRESRNRDLKTKRRVYAKARISEYWIIDPEKEAITVLTLSDRTYKVHGAFKHGDEATSELLPGFTLDVSAVYAAGQGK